MEKIELTGQGFSSSILIGERLENIDQYLPDKPVFIITDSNIHNLYYNTFPKAPVFITEPGEDSKQLSKTEQIYRWLLESNADRNSFILGIGGGVVCDIAGFIASTYMRGVEFGFVSTSLLSQVDASVGGKNGVNLDGYKNIIGAFNQPRFVLCDTNMLKTLPHEELINGFAEMIKHALISSLSLFEQLENDSDKLLSLEQNLLKWHIAESVKVKAKIVSDDEREAGIRKLLNFGHTWGHAIEKVTGISHGRAVSLGMEFASRISKEKGLISSKDYQRIINLIKSYGLPTCMNLNPSTVFNAMTKDKKRTNDSIDFILLKGVGMPIIEKIAISELENHIQPKGKA